MCEQWLGQGSVNSPNPTGTVPFPRCFCQSKISAGKLGRCLGGVPALGSPDADDADILKPRLKTIVSNS